MKYKINDCFMDTDGDIVRIVDLKLSPADYKYPPRWAQNELYEVVYKCNDYCRKHSAWLYQTEIDTRFIYLDDNTKVKYL